MTSKDVSKIIKSLIPIQDLERMENVHGIRACNQDNAGVLYIPLFYKKKIEDIIEMETNDEGFVNPWKAAKLILLAWHQGIGTQILKG